MWGCGRSPHPHIYPSPLLEGNFSSALIIVCIEKTQARESSFPAGGCFFSRLIIYFISWVVFSPQIIEHNTFYYALRCWPAPLFFGPKIELFPSALHRSILALGLTQAGANIEVTRLS